MFANNAKLLKNILLFEIKMNNYGNLEKLTFPRVSV